ncbi:MAG: tetratricopeptide repeat protein [Candidatus Cloacimonetes bacterium]|nr:tetratricopeptide repeat protein [Candidatus Cloacimonadota bacterium]
MKTKSLTKKQLYALVGPLIQKAYQVMTSHPDECLSLGLQALELAKQHSFDFGIGHAYIHIGLGYYHQGELADAMENYKKAEAVFVKINNIPGLRGVYNNIGTVYDDWQDCENALQYYQMNLDLQQEGDDPKVKCNILINIGMIHYGSGDFQAARHCFQEALDLSRSIGFAYGESNALGHLGKIMLQENDFEAALSHFRQAIHVAEQNNLTARVVHLLNNIADACLKRRDYPKAIEYLSQAMEKAISINAKLSMSTIALKFATIYRDLGDRELQKSHLERCLSLAIPENYRYNAVIALQELAKMYEFEGDYKKALELYWQYQEIQKYLNDQTRIQHIEQLRVQMQVAEKEREMELIRCSNQALEKQSKLIMRQKNKLEKAEKALTEWNHSLELRVTEEIMKRQQQEQIVIQKSKLESLGRLSAGIAHEINQPLGMISIGIQNLFNNLSSGQVDKDYIDEKSQHFTENIDRIRKIIDHIRVFSRDQQSEIPALIDTRTVIENALSMLRAQCKEHNISLEFSPAPEPLLILGNKYRLEQVILNLLSNAKAAVEERFDVFDDAKHIRIRNYLRDQIVIIEVEDNGCGIAEQDLQQIFEPFFTTKTESMGTGLGLSICYGIINEMQGKIGCKSQKASGTTISIELPACL